MKTVVGKEILSTFPVSELKQDFQSGAKFGEGVDGWGLVHFQLVESMVEIPSKEFALEYVQGFIKKYGEEPIFILDNDQPWSKKITIQNEKFQADRESYSNTKKSYCELATAE